MYVIIYIMAIIKKNAERYGGAMWYQNVIADLSKDTLYTRKQIYNELKQIKPTLSKDSFNWMINKLVKEGVLCREQRGMYVTWDDSNCLSEKNIYVPQYSKKSNEIAMTIEDEFPLVDFVCFESVQLNEFLNHMIAQNTFFIMVERDALDSVFRYLQEEDFGNTLIKPRNQEWDAYWTRDSIVLLNLVSEHPRNTEMKHGISIEQLLVDVVAEKTFRLLYSKNEIYRIYETADRLYAIDYTRLLRYARRRGKVEEIGKYIGGR